MIINENFNDIILNYQAIIHNYTNFFYNNVKIFKNNNYYEKIYTHGLNIIQNIFNISASHFYNISDVNNNCEKGYIYFIEFINQLGINNYNDNNIELTLKDAILFSYKKTIFYLDKNNEHNENNENNINNNEKEIFYILNSYIFLVNNINLIINRNIYNFFDNNNLDNNNNNNNIHNELLINNNNINKIIKKINNILKFNSTLNKLIYINNGINNLISIINDYNTDFINNNNNNNNTLIDYNINKNINKNIIN